MTVYVGGVTAGAVDFATTLGAQAAAVHRRGRAAERAAADDRVPLAGDPAAGRGHEPAQHRRRARRDRGDLPVGLARRRCSASSQGPIESFIPVMLFAIVFGLSMDYEVFLISRMHERWTQTRDNSRAVAEGLALTGRVVTAAAAIMVCVFLSFMLGEERVIKEFGLSLASAVFLDALVVRCLLLPAALHLIGPSHVVAAGLARPAAAAREHRGHAACRRPPAGQERRLAATPARIARARQPASRPRERRAERHSGGGRAGALALLCAAALGAPARARPRGGARRARASARRRVVSSRAGVPSRDARSAARERAAACRSASCPPRQGHTRTRAVPARHHSGSARRILRLSARRRRRALSLRPVGHRRRRRRLARRRAGAPKTRRSCCAPGCSPRQIAGRRRLRRHRRQPATPTAALARRPCTRAIVGRRCSLRPRAATLLARVAALGRTQALLVADLPGRRRRARGPARAQRGRGAGELLIVVQRGALGARARAAVERRRGARRAAAAGAQLAEHQRARADRGCRSRAHDPRPSRAAPIPRRHARQADRHRRRAATRRACAR